MRGHNTMAANSSTHGTAEAVRRCSISQANLWRGFLSTCFYLRAFEETNDKHNWIILSV